MFTLPATTMARTTSSLMAPQGAAGGAGSGLAVPVPDEGGVQVDRVRHHGGAEHADGQQRAVGAGQPRHQPAAAAAGSGGATNSPARKPTATIDQQPDDDAFEGALAAPVLGQQQGGGDGDGDQRADDQRQVEEELQGEGPADDLGDVGGHGHQLGLHPVRQPGPAPGAGADQRRQRLPGQPADLGREVLDERGHQGGADQDPQQQVAVAGSGGGVGGDVARVDVGDRGDEGRDRAGASGRGATPVGSVVVDIARWPSCSARTVLGGSEEPPSRDERDKRSGVVVALC